MRYSPLVIFILAVFFVLSCSTQKTTTIPTKNNISEKVMKSEEEWKKELTEEEFLVTRKKGTERKYSSEFNDNKRKGDYVCTCCKTPLFKSDHKYDSGSGWPSFYDVANDSTVIIKKDTSHGMIREEILCAKCDAHLGHVFNDGPQKHTGLRYCVNGISLKFEEKK